MPLYPHPPRHKSCGVRAWIVASFRMLCRMGTLARRDSTDGQECPSYIALFCMDICGRVLTIPAAPPGSRTMMKTTMPDMHRPATIALAAWCVA